MWIRIRTEPVRPRFRSGSVILFPDPDLVPDSTFVDKNMYNFALPVINIVFATWITNWKLESFIKKPIKTGRSSMLPVRISLGQQNTININTNKRFSQWYSVDFTHPEVREFGILTYVLGTVLFPGSGFYWYLYTYCTVLCICTFIPSCTWYGILYNCTYFTYVFVKHSQYIINGF
jgi:hypothetical protein